MRAAIAKRPRSRVRTSRSKNALHGGIVGVQAGTLPEFIQPQLATLAKAAPAGDQWLHEVKLDGYRMLCRIHQGKADFISRNEQPWTERLSHLAEAANDLPVTEAFLDGEVVAMQPNGITDFQILQNVFRRNKVHKLLYYVFDVLFVDGKDLRGVPLESRKKVLARLLDPVGPKHSFRYTDHVVGHGAEVFRQAARLGLEGIICKRRLEPHLPGRGHDWLKVKCVQTEEFVIGGYTAPGGSRHGFGALLLGYHDEHDELVYSGKVGTGFNDRLLTELRSKMDQLAQRESPFKDLRGKTGPARNATWVKPKLVAQISFSNRTEEGYLRHPSFLGLREDKSAREVVREKPIAL